MDGPSIATVFRFRQWKAAKSERAPKLDGGNTLSLLFHADNHLLHSVGRLNKLAGLQSAGSRFAHAVENVHDAQKILLNSLYILYTETLPAEDRANREYHMQLPAEDQRELLHGFSENILFAAEAVAFGFRVRGIEAYTRDLREPAQQLWAALEALRYVYRSQALKCGESRADGRLREALRDFDGAWTLFESRICSAYFAVSDAHRPMADRRGALAVADTDSFVQLFSRTLDGALASKLMDAEDIINYEPFIIFALPRLALVTGLLRQPGAFAVLDNLESSRRWFFGNADRILGIKVGLAKLSPRELRRLERALVDRPEAANHGSPSSGSSSASQSPSHSVPEDEEEDEVPIAVTLRRGQSARSAANKSGTLNRDSLQSTELFREISAVADELHSGRRTKDVVQVISRTFDAFFARM